MRILFILKKNEVYGFSSYCRRSSGLWNSVQFTVSYLNAIDAGFEAKMVEVHDNNDIDREVTLFRPDLVIVEALWVVPEKFDVLKKIHPTVKWFCHLHSHIPFLALEGIAVQWLLGYAERGVGVIANSVPAYKALSVILSQKELIFLPNIYLMHKKKYCRAIEPGVINVGCFGAVRPLKNQLIQAMAAIRFAQEKKCALRFHINATRSETGGDPVLKNLRELFAKTPGTHLIQHGWMEPAHFLDTLRHHIDIGLQVSLTETFNVVTADYVTVGLPVVASKEVYWLSDWSKAKDDSVDDIVRQMHFAWRHRWLIRWNRFKLQEAIDFAQDLWFSFCRREGLRR